MLLLLDKPKGITSHDVVDFVRKVTHERRVGHAGTLDPNATGLLIVGVGRESTKKLGDLTKNTRKTYEATIVLGEERDTDDSEGKTVKSLSLRNSKKPEKKQIQETLGQFLGEQMQVPPAYSAIKLSGKKAYELARKGVSVSLSSRTITVYSLKLLNYEFPVLNVLFEVSSGTYIRALARDIGRKLGTYAYLGELRRTKIGEYDVLDATPLNKLQDFWEKNNNSNHN